MYFPNELNSLTSIALKFPGMTQLRSSLFDYNTLQLFWSRCIVFIRRGNATVSIARFWILPFVLRPVLFSEAHQLSHRSNTSNGRTGPNSAPLPTPERPLSGGRQGHTGHSLGGLFYPRRIVTRGSVATASPSRTVRAAPEWVVTHTHRHTHTSRGQHPSRQPTV